MNKNPITNQQIIKTLERSGSVETAAFLLGVNRQLIYGRAKTDKALKNALKATKRPNMLFLYVSDMLAEELEQARANEPDNPSMSAFLRRLLLRVDL